MKYVVSWISKAGLGEADAERSLAVFAKWSPLPTAAFSEFLGRVDGRGGFAVVETDDPSAVLRDASIFGAWFDFDVCPVVDIIELARVAGEAVEFRKSVK
jgi:hypothetical protein